MTGKHGNHHRGFRESTPTTTLTCPTCDKETTYKDSFLRQHPDTKYCSRPCGGRASRTRITIQCDHCKKSFTDAPSRISKRQHSFCSKECSAAWQRKPGAKWRDKKQIANYMREWRKKHPHFAGDAQRKRRALKKTGSAAPFTHDQWLSLLDEHNHTCLSCGSIDELSLDHVIPLSKGGTHTHDNFQILCLTCNKRKASKTTDYRA